MGSRRIHPYLVLSLALLAALIVPNLSPVRTSLRARDAGRASILECSRSDIRRCRVALYGVLPGELSNLTAQDQIHFFIGGRLVYAAAQTRVLRAIQDHGKDIGTLVVTSGPWMVTVRKPQFYTHGAYAAAYVVERAAGALDWEDPNLFRDKRATKQDPFGHSLVASDTKRDDLYAPAAASEGVQPRAKGSRRNQAMQPAVAVVQQPAAAAPPPPAPAPQTVNIVNNIGTPATNSSSSSSTAAGTAAGDDYLHPRVALRAQLGTGNSPTGMYGVGLDLYFATTNVPLSLSYGGYDSRLFMDPSRGTVRYQTTSVGTGYLLGHKAAQLRFGGDLVRTHAAITPGGADAKGLAISEDHRDNHTYLGLVPSLGLNVLTDEHSFFFLSVGQYYSLRGESKSDPGATYTQVSNSRNPNEVHNSATTANLGFGYNF